jgi:hypothetical protein
VCASAYRSYLVSISLADSDINPSIECDDISELPVGGKDILACDDAIGGDNNGDSQVSELPVAPLLSPEVLMKASDGKLQALNASASDAHQDSDNQAQQSTPGEAPKDVLLSCGAYKDEEGREGVTVPLSVNGDQEDLQPEQPVASVKKPGENIVNRRVAKYFQVDDAVNPELYYCMEL